MGCQRQKLLVVTLEKLSVTALNDYSRIMLALDLEPELMERSRANKQWGGQQKAWSKLNPKLSKVHVRSFILVVAHALGRQLNFHTHLHIPVSSGVSAHKKIVGLILDVLTGTS